jgi:hypothetical protein
MSRKQSPKAAATSAQPGPIIRIAVLKNPKTGRDVFERVTADGRLSSRAAARIGVQRVRAWKEVPAASWASATKAVRAGAGAAKRASSSK